MKYNQLRSGRPGRLLLALLFGIACSCASGQGFGYAHGTSIVILRSPRLLLAAVDSKETYREYLSDGTERVTERNHCKAAKIGDYYAMAANITRGTNGFDALAELASVYRGGDSIDAFAQAAVEVIPSRLRALLGLIRTTSPSVFAETYKDRPATQIALIGVSDHRPVTKILQFVATERGDAVDITAQVVPCPGDCKAYAYALGVTEKVTAAFSARPDLFVHPSEAGIEGLIRLEYADRPDVVGGPMSVVKATPGGITQIRDGACGERGQAGAL